MIKSPFHQNIKKPETRVFIVVQGSDKQYHQIVLTNEEYKKFMVAFQTTFIDNVVSVDQNAEGIAIVNKMKSRKIDIHTEGIEPFY